MKWSSIDVKLFFHLFRPAAEMIAPKLDDVNLSLHAAAHRAFSLWPTVSSAVCCICSGDTRSFLLSHTFCSSEARYSWLINTSSTSGMSNWFPWGSGDRIQCRAIPKTKKCNWKANFSWHATSNRVTFTYDASICKNNPRKFCKL